MSVSVSEKRYNAGASSANWFKSVPANVMNALKTCPDFWQGWHDYRPKQTKYGVLIEDPTRPGGFCKTSEEA